MERYFIRSVTIATPAGHYMEPAIEAVQYGKHVICGKLLKISLAAKGIAKTQDNG